MGAADGGIVCPARKRTVRADQSAISVRGDRAWISWVDRTARLTNRGRSDLVAEALLRFAKSEGVDPPPPRVTPTGAL